MTVAVLPVLKRRTDSRGTQEEAAKEGGGEPGVGGTVGAGEESLGKGWSVVTDAAKKVGTRLRRPLDGAVRMALMISERQGGAHQVSLYVERNAGEGTEKGIVLSFRG